MPTKDLLRLRSLLTAAITRCGLNRPATPAGRIPSFVTADQTATVYASLTPNPSPTKSPAPLMGLLGLAGAALLAVRRIV
ncbi:MAG TPA: hypothetical protein O0X38_01460 [Methanocorpusculum sp.]|nr:hypothetical protein [Methanocorpusculum sp.]